MKEILFLKTLVTFSLQTCIKTFTLLLKVFRNKYSRNTSLAVPDYSQVSEDSRNRELTFLGPLFTYPARKDRPVIAFEIFGGISKNKF